MREADAGEVGLQSGCLRKGMWGKDAVNAVGAVANRYFCNHFDGPRKRVAARTEGENCRIGWEEFLRTRLTL